MATLKDVAQEAGVSVATASYTLRGGNHVSKATEEKVLKAAHELNYTTNLSARSLRYGKTGIIEIAVHELDLPYFYSKFTSAAADVIDEYGYQALILQTGVNRKTVKEAVSTISNQICDGIILNATGISPEEIKSLAGNRPTVLLDECSIPPLIDTVMTPNEDGAAVATKHLIDIGCKRIAMLGAEYEDDTSLLAAFGTGPLRLRGFKAAMRAAGRPVTVNTVIPAEWTVEPGRQAAHQLVDSGMPFDALFCATDSLALGAIRGFADRGIRVPESIKIVGFDGISVGEYTVPRISTIRIDMDDFARKAVGMLTDRIGKTSISEPRRMIANYTLQVRESSVAQ